MISFNRNRDKVKVFCIGRNKTGTTSLKNLFKELGFKVGNQEEAELLKHDYANGNWKKIIKYCKTADFFQDAPFSWPYTWLILHEHFPDAKFILSTRNSEEWYKSLVNHHTQSFSSSELPPTKEDLKNSLYRGKYRGHSWESNRIVWKTPVDDLYNKDLFIKNYNRHNEDVLHFFKGKENFIEIDLSHSTSFKNLIEFLDVKTDLSEFPHKNKRR